MRREWLLALLELLKVRARTVDDIVAQSSPYFLDVIAYNPDAVAKQWKDRASTVASLRGIRDALAALPAWEPGAMEAELRALAERMGLGDKAAKLFQPLRVALTGESASPGIFDVLAILGRERSLTRLDAAIAFTGPPSDA